MSASALFNEHWFRVKDLSPRLATDVEITRHIYRQQVQYVIHRRSTGGYSRLDSHAFELVGKLDGTLTVGSLWELSLQLLDQNAPTQTDFIQLLAQLHEAELLVVNKKLNAEQLFNRGQQKNRNEKIQRYFNPLFLRFKLCDPDPLLELITPKLSWLFNRSVLILWTLLLFFSIAALIPHWGELRAEIAGFELMSPRYALIFLLVYPSLKFLHEVAHGAATKRFGGEVHEFGIALMVLLPIPYLDASSAASFSSKHQRVIVGAAGIFMEVGLAAVAVIVWLNSGGVLHDVALVLMVVGGISTLLVNGNPLLKFDGYYVMADYIEIPDLAAKSKNYIRERTAQLLRLTDTINVPLADDQERYWLAGYCILSAIYRVTLMLGIAYLLSGKFFIFGVALALWIVYSQIARPLWRFARYLAAHSTATSTGPLLFGGGSIVALLMVVTLLPLPMSTVAEGVVWLPNNAIVRAPHDCHITKQFTQKGDFVQIGDPLFSCEDPLLIDQYEIAQAELRELEAKHYGIASTDRVKRTLLENKISTSKSKLNRIQEQIIAQNVTAKLSGRLVIEGESTLTGRFVKKGTIVVYIVAQQGRAIHVAVSQDNIHKINVNSQIIKMRFVGGVAGNLVYPTSIVQNTHQASFEVPSSSLTTNGGGRLLADSRGEGRTVVDPVFNLELSWPANAPSLYVGSRVSVRFYHGVQPVLYRIVSEVQRAFIKGMQV